MQWEVTGADQTTGKDKTIIIEADNAESAHRRGNRRGLLVEKVQLVGAKPPAATPQPAQVVEYAKITNLRNEAAPVARRSRSPLIWIALGVCLGAVGLLAMLVMFTAKSRQAPAIAYTPPPPVVAPPAPPVLQQLPPKPVIVKSPQNALQEFIKLELRVDTSSYDCAVALRTFDASGSAQEYADRIYEMARMFNISPKDACKSVLYAKQTLSVAGMETNCLNVLNMFLKTRGTVPDDMKPDDISEAWVMEMLGITDANIAAKMRARKPDDALLLAAQKLMKIDDAAAGVDALKDYTLALSIMDMRCTENELQLAKRVAETCDELSGLVPNMKCSAILTDLVNDTPLWHDSADLNEYLNTYLIDLASIYIYNFDADTAKPEQHKKSEYFRAMKIASLRFDEPPTKIAVLVSAKSKTLKAKNCREILDQLMELAHQSPQGHLRCADLLPSIK